MKKHIEIYHEVLVLRGYLDYENSEECIIVVHGIGGNKLGNKFIFNHFSRKANKNNLSTLRIDFAGTGESDGEYSETNHLDQAFQLSKIICYAKEVLKFKKINLVGTSIGCLVILQCLKLYSQDINKIVLWNPNIDIEKYKNEFSNSSGDMDMGGLLLTEEYVANLEKLNIEKDFSAYKIAVAHGAKDYNFNNEYVSNFVSANKCAYKIIDDGDHLFESVEARKKLFCYTLNYISESIQQ